MVQIIISSAHAQPCTKSASIKKYSDHWYGGWGVQKWHTSFAGVYKQCKLLIFVLQDPAFVILSFVCGINFWCSQILTILVAFSTNAHTWNTSEATFS